MAKSKFYELIKNAKIEKDVEHVYKKLADKMLPMVYEVGFLRK